MDSNACVEVHEDLLKEQLLEEAEEKKRLKVMLNASKNSLFFRTIPGVHADTGITDFHSLCECNRLLQGGLGCVNTGLIKPMYMQKKVWKREEGKYSSNIYSAQILLRIKLILWRLLFNIK